MEQVRRFQFDAQSLTPAYTETAFATAGGTIKSKYNMSHAPLAPAVINSFEAKERKSAFANARAMPAGLQR